MHNGIFLKRIQSGRGGRTYDIIKEYTMGTNAVSKSLTNELIISVRTKESIKAAASARLHLISILTNWHQHLISPLVLVWPSRAEKSNASCTQTIFCCYRLMKRGLSILEKYSNDWALPMNIEVKNHDHSEKNLVLLTKNMSLQYSKQFLIMSPVIIIWVWQSQPLHSSIPPNLN